MSERLARLDAALDARRDDLVALAGALVGADSQIPPHADERAVAALLRERLAALGLPPGELLHDDPARPSVVTRIAGAGGGPHLLLNGHLDTKPAGDRAAWASDPHVASVRDGDLHGLGSADMKGALAAMAIAAAALRDAGLRLRGDLVLAFVADEEAGGRWGARAVAERLGPVDACLIGEPSGWTRDWEALHLVSCGSCCFRVRVRGTQTHSSLADRLPVVNAAAKAAELMVAIGDELELDHRAHPLDGSGPLLNVGVLLHGGVWFGVVPGEAEFGCDLRTVPGMTRAAVHGALERWLERRRARDPRLDAELILEPGLEWVPWAEIDGGHPLVAAAQAAAAEVLGAAPPLAVFPGTTDAPWFDRAGIPTIPSFGPGVLTRCHAPNERVGVERLHEAARIYARTALGYCGLADA